METATPKMNLVERQRNAERVLGALQDHSPLSRADIAENTGISYPTVSKIVTQLLQTEVVEEREDNYSGLGRPRKVYQLASLTRMVIGLVLSPVRCELVIGGCDGTIQDESTRFFDMPQCYDELIQLIIEEIDLLKKDFSFEPLGLGMTVPGQIDLNEQRIISCPNIPQLNGHKIGDDLQRLLGLQTTIVQCMHGAFLAERMFGVAKEIDNFVLMTHSGGIGIAVCNNGQLMQGACGLAGEFGHTIVANNGPLCGCGNRGCLESLASDRAIAEVISEKIGRSVNFHEVIELIQSGKIDMAEVVNSAVEYLAVGVASIINIFNPEAVFLYGYIWSIDNNLFEYFQSLVEERTLKASYLQCRFISNQGRPQIVERRGAIAALVHQITVRRSSKHPELV